MDVTHTPLHGLLRIVPRIFRDARGYFLEAFNAEAFRAAGLNEKFVQDNLSFSAKGTLRGLHYQRAPHAQGKLIRVLSGSVFDVAVDIRPDSPTFGRWHAETLSSENFVSLYVPPGFAHGFCVTSENALFFYKCTTPYRPEAEGGIRWDDPELAIPWPGEAGPPLVSPKDRVLPLFKNFANRG